MTTKGRTDFYKPPTKAEQEFLYSGKSPGMTFEAFDECVVSWARNEYGEHFSKALWRDEMQGMSQAKSFSLSLSLRPTRLPTFQSAKIFL